MTDEKPVEPVEESWAQRAMRLDAEPVVVAKVMAAPTGRTIIRSAGARPGR